MVPMDFARLMFDDEPLNEPLIAVLMQSIRAGLELPAPVLMELPDGKFKIVDGRNRIEAVRRTGATEFSAYLVEKCSPERLEELRRGLNAHRGTN